MAGILCSPFFPNSKRSEQSEEENDSGNHRWLDTERKNVGGHLGLQVDIDCHAHLCNDDRTRDQEELISGFRGQRSPKPWQQEQAPDDHLHQFASENRLLGKMTLLNLDIKPSTEWLEEFEESEREHQNSQEQR